MDRYHLQGLPVASQPYMHCGCQPQQCLPAVGVYVPSYHHMPYTPVATPQNSTTLLNSLVNLPTASQVAWQSVAASATRAPAHVKVMEHTSAPVWITDTTENESHLSRQAYTTCALGITQLLTRAIPRGSGTILPLCHPYLQSTRSISNNCAPRSTQSVCRQSLASTQPLNQQRAQQAVLPQQHINNTIKLYQTNFFR
jgi:hypothetical protein